LLNDYNITADSLKGYTTNRTPFWKYIDFK
jgi:hypothetical protein